MRVILASADGFPTPRVGWVEVVKSVGIPTRFAPISSPLIGTGLACFVVTAIPKIILGGIAVSLMANGLYSATGTMVSA